MEYNYLGKSGMQVSKICCGTHDWHTDEQSQVIAKKSFERGINFFDTSCSYGEQGEIEIRTGKILKALPRDEIVLATKVRFGYGAKGPNARGLSRKHIRHSIDISLKRLQVDFVDLYQLHGYVADCPLEETVLELDYLIKQGKILYWGLSNFNAEFTINILNVCDSLGVARPISHQPQYSLVESGIVDSSGPTMGIDRLAPKYGFGIIPYSPLAGGLLTGKYRHGIPDDSRMAGNTWKTWQEKILSPANTDLVNALLPIAEELGITLTQLSLAWLLNKSFVDSVVTGFTKTSQIDDSVQAAGIELSEDVMSRISELRKDHKQAAQLAVI